MTSKEKLTAAFADLKNKTSAKPEILLVLGSGLGDFADRLEESESVNYSDIVGFPTSTVEGHKGRFVFGKLCGKSIAVMQGRVHYYEGYSMSDVVLPLRIIRMLGAEKLILTNAAGGINPDFAVGDFMLITDHISSFVPSPLIGENIDTLGVRFPDMTKVYNEELAEKTRRAAKKLSITLKEGVYLQTSGPQYETPTEVRLYKSLGADAVGMSTACEATAAAHAGYKILGISCISNAAAGLSKTPLTHEEVKLAGEAAKESFASLITEIIRTV